jgi:hypothetical protein
VRSSSLAALPEQTGEEFNSRRIESEGGSEGRRISPWVPLRQENTPGAGEESTV